MIPTDGTYSYGRPWFENSLVQPAPSLFIHTIWHRYMFHCARRSGKSVSMDTLLDYATMNPILREILSGKLPLVASIGYHVHGGDPAKAGIPRWAIELLNPSKEKEV